MHSKKRFRILLVLTLIAAYSPLAVCLPQLAGIGVNWFFVLFFPGCMIGVVSSLEGVWAGAGVTLLCLSLLVTSCFLLRHWSWSLVVVPLLVFVISLLQGLLCVKVIQGLNAL